MSGQWLKFVSHPPLCFPRQKLAERKAEIDDVRNRYEECRQQIIAHADRSQQIDDHCHDLVDEIEAVKAHGKRDLDEAHGLVRKLEDRLQKQEDRHRKELDDSERRRKRDIATLEGVRLIFYAG